MLQCVQPDVGKLKASAGRQVPAKDPLAWVEPSDGHYAFSLSGTRSFCLCRSWPIQHTALPQLELSASCRSRMSLRVSCAALDPCWAGASFGATGIVLGVLRPELRSRKWPGPVNMASGQPPCGDSLCENLLIPLQSWLIHLPWNPGWTLQSLLTQSRRLHVALCCIHRPATPLRPMYVLYTYMERLGTQ